MIVDTIAAIATAPGQGGVAIVRISGPDAEKVLQAVFRPVKKTAFPLQSHMLTYGFAYDRDTLVDECMAVIMRAPRSYTRQDVAQLQLHGGHLAASRTLNACILAGARLAEPGEFTRRAFLNGRIDLSQAEAVMEIISAQSEKAHRAALQQLSGGPSSFIHTALDELYRISAGIAACVDYPEEITQAEASADALPQIQHLKQQLESACNERAARLARLGLNAVLCGSPNVGKSSLLNALLGEEKAIVTAIPGTTRDVVQGSLWLDGCQIHLTDTAGLRETDDPVEKIGVSRSGKAMEEADVVLCVLDSSRTLTADEELLLRSLPDQALILLNKSDLVSVITPDDILPYTSLPCIVLSANSPDSLSPLKTRLKEICALADQTVLTQPRHLEAARRAISYLDRAIETLHSGVAIDFVAIDLHGAMCCLGEITGEQVDEKLLDAVFANFCVGK